MFKKEDFTQLIANDVLGPTNTEDDAKSQK